MSNEVQKYTPIEALSHNPQEVLDTIDINLGTGALTEFDLPRVKIPQGFTGKFQVPSLEGDGDAKIITGVIVHHRDVRAWWPVEDAQGNKPPQCSSSNGVVGSCADPEENGPGGDCSKCRFAVFGTGKEGRGQACKQTKQLFLIRGDNLLPEVLALPPTSLKAAKQYLLLLASQRVPYYACVTELTLEKATNPQNKEYGKVAFRFVRRIEEAEANVAMKLGQMLAAKVSKLKTNAADFAGSEERPF
jgi:hypothetical protein